MLQNKMQFNEDQNTPRGDYQEIIRAEMTPMTAWIANNGNYVLFINTEHYKRDRFIIRKPKQKSTHSQNDSKQKEVAFSDAVEKYP